MNRLSGKEKGEEGQLSAGQSKEGCLFQKRRRSESRLTGLKKEGN